jgi:hypothetical protein
VLRDRIVALTKHDLDIKGYRHGTAVILPV